MAAADLGNLGDKEFTHQKCSFGVEEAKLSGNLGQIQQTVSAKKKKKKKKTQNSPFIAFPDNQNNSFYNSQEAAKQKYSENLHFLLTREYPTLKNTDKKQHLLR